MSITHGYIFLEDCLLKFSAQLYFMYVFIHPFIDSVLMWPHQAFIALHGLSVAAVKRGHSSLCCWDLSLKLFLLLQAVCTGSRCANFSCSSIRAQYVLHIGLYRTCAGCSTVRWLNCSVAWGSSWTRVEPASTALEGELPPLDHQAIPCPILKLDCLCFWYWIVWAVAIVWK